MRLIAEHRVVTATNAGMRRNSTAERLLAPGGAAPAGVPGMVLAWTSSAT
jgi:hypothetical protein